MEPAAMQLDEADPKGLIREAYRIEGIGPAECRSIFVDWALSLPVGRSQDAALHRVLAAYGGADAHPMTAVLRAALGPAPAPVRRGGRTGRLGR